MPTSDKNIYIMETEIKPNRYAVMILAFTTVISLICWVANEMRIFQVGITEMRIGSIASITGSVIPILLFLTDRRRYADPRMKYVVILGAGTFTFSVGLLITFHTTIMLLFPIFFAMLYKSKKLGNLAALCSFFCVIVTPVLGYLLHTWDIPFFQELIKIGTNGAEVTVTGGSDQASWNYVAEIILYLVVPKILMVGSSAILLRYVIKLGAEHVENQIELHRISQIDNLTGLYNQNTYKEVLNLLQSENTSERIGVLYFDVNGLKQLNDSKGHEYGDLLLQRNAKSILGLCTDDRISAFRIGGDEFVLMIMGATEALCSQKVTEWEDGIQKINEDNERYYDGIVCSMAVGFAVGAAKEVENIVKMADSYMYRNKERMKEMKAMATV